MICDWGEDRKERWYKIENLIIRSKLVKRSSGLVSFKID